MVAMRMINVTGLDRGRGAFWGCLSRRIGAFVQFAEEAYFRKITSDYTWLMLCAISANDYCRVLCAVPAK